MERGIAEGVRHGGRNALERGIEWGFDGEQGSDPGGVVRKSGHLVDGMVIVSLIEYNHALEGPVDLFGTVTVEENVIFENHIDEANTTDLDKLGWMDTPLETETEIGREVCGGHNNHDDHIRHGGHDELGNLT